MLPKGTQGIIKNTTYAEKSLMAKETYKVSFKKQLEKILQNSLKSTKPKVDEKTKMKQSLEKDKKLIYRMREKSRKELRRLLGKVAPFEELKG